MENIGIIAFSFGLTEEEEYGIYPNKCNEIIGKIARKIYRRIQRADNIPVLILQWEIALDYTFQEVKIRPDLIINRTQPNERHLSSEEIIAQAIPIFKELGVTKVISIAQYLQNFKCKKLLKKAGFEILPVKIEKIGFCKESLQRWTRGPIQLALYTIQQLISSHSN